MRGFVIPYILSGITLKLLFKMKLKLFSSTINDVQYSISYSSGDLPASFLDLYKLSESDKIYKRVDNGMPVTFSFDAEFTGLIYPRDSLRVVQLFDNDKNVWIVDVDFDIKPELLYSVLTSENIKIGHYMLHDLVMVKGFFKETMSLKNYPRIPNIKDTKLLSFLTRRYTSRHGYKTVCQELLNISVNKDVTLDFGKNWEENPELLNYTIVDTLYLQQVYEALYEKVEEKHIELMKMLFEGLNLQSELILHRIGMGIYLHNYDCKEPETVYHVYN